MLPIYFWEDTRVFPLYGTGASAALLILSAIHARWTRPFRVPKYVPVLRTGDEDRAADFAAQQNTNTLRRLFQQTGRPAVFLARLSRLVCCVLLFGLALTTLLRRHVDTLRTDNAPWWPELVECEVYIYAFVLALGRILSHQHGGPIAAHLNIVLLVTLGVYAYRDALPLVLRNQDPADAADGIFLWMKMFLLFAAAVALPLLAPRTYIPCNPSQPTVADPGKEQTCSLFSLVTFNWLNETVSKASRVSHLPLHEFPPLADTNAAKSLAERSFKDIDPFLLGKEEHLFWGLLRIFRKDYLAFSALAALGAVLKLSRAIAAKGLLAYLEVGGPKSNVYPWAWSLLLLVGPTAVTFCEEWGQWITSVVGARIEAIVTELLFEHALRIRVKAESSSDGTSTSGDDTTDKKGQLLGRLNNLVTSDLNNIKRGNKHWLQLFIEVPVIIVSSIIFVYNVLGWSAIIGLACMCALLPVPGYLSSWIQSFQAGKMAKTDARVQLINETLNVVRMIKLFGWERRVTGQIEERREAELKFLRKTKFLELLNNLINFTIPLFTMAFTFGAYTMIFGGELTASRLFSSYAAFETIQHNLHMIFYAIPICTQAMVSLDRMNEVIYHTELLDEFEDKKATSHDAPTTFALVVQDLDVLGIARTTFTWTKNDEGSETPVTLQTATPATSGGRGQRKFVLNIEDDVTFKRGGINLVVGPTGSGKTSLLMALLGEMHAIPSGPDSFVSVPRTGGIAYAAQESWIQNETIRENILFGSPYDEDRYNKVIKQCALERDLGLFDAGDQTEVGEKGITLSGGQKARISLARAVYSSAEILLLDDVLAALDVHTGRWIVDKCFKGDLIRGRTVILVSHNVALTRPVAEFVVALGTGGRVVSQGSFEKALKEDHELQAELAAEKEHLKKAEEKIDASPFEDEEKKDGKLVVAEEINVGRVGWQAFMLYFSNVAKPAWLPAYWAVYIGALVVTHMGINGQTYFLGYWAAQYEDHAPSEVSVPYYLAIYVLIVWILLAVYAACWSLYVYGNNRASRLIHRNLLDSVLGTTLRWLDITPTSRIITRCTADIQSVDSEVAAQLHSVVEGSIFLLLKVGTVVFMLPIYIVPSVIVFVLGVLISQIYMRAQMSVKREMSNAKAPVLGHFGSAISGLVSIRAYGAQEAFKKESYARMDRYNRAGLTYEALNRWVTIRVDILGTALSAVLAVYLTYWGHLSASNTGFAIIMSVGFSSFILGWLRQFNDFQVTGALERIQQYMTIEQEPKPTAEGVPPAYWPASGDLRVEKLNARYSADGPAVLHDLSFEIKSGERVGIVGRTGSGKSSLTLALLRCILTQGKVYYDGIPTDSINLDVLRSNITIIPQMPELLSGTLRQNLDPFGQYDDAILNDALRSAGLFSLQEEGDHARITLDSEIAGGGSNLSVGQRQIIALARAIVRRSKLLILDEATSAIDYETDTIIQRSLREELGRDITVLTVAHRLQSIMDADKIMVLDAGNIVEYDKPSELLQITGGYFRGLVDESGDKAALYALAGSSA